MCEPNWSRNIGSTHKLQLHSSHELQSSQCITTQLGLPLLLWLSNRLIRLQFTNCISLDQGFNSLMVYSISDLHVQISAGNADTASLAPVNDLRDTLAMKPSLVFNNSECNPMHKNAWNPWLELDPWLELALSSQMRASTKLSSTRTSRPGRPRIEPLGMTRSTSISAQFLYRFGHRTLKLNIHPKRIPTAMKQIIWPLFETMQYWPLVNFDRWLLTIPK